MPPELVPIELHGDKPRQYPIEPRLPIVEALTFSSQYSLPHAFTGGIATNAYQTEWMKKQKVNFPTRHVRDVDVLIFEREYKGSILSDVYNRGGFKTRKERPKNIPFCVGVEKVDVDADTIDWFFQDTKNPRTVEELAYITKSRISKTDCYSMKIPIVPLEVHLAFKLVSFPHQVKNYKRRQLEKTSKIAFDNIKYSSYI